MLVYQNDGDVFPLLGKALEGPFNLRGLGLGVDDKKVALRIGAVGDVLCQMCQIDFMVFLMRGSETKWGRVRRTYSDASEEETCHGAREHVQVSPTIFDEG